MLSDAKKKNKSENYSLGQSMFSMFVFLANLFADVSSILLANTDLVVEFP